MSKYRDLQKKAKDLGLPASGTTEELEARIAEYETSEVEEVEEVESREEPRYDGTSTPEVVEEEPEEEYNTAIILNDSGNELRRYTEEVHGENYVELARNYAQKHGNRMDLRLLKPAFVCPHCGGKIYDK